jgi:DNA-directed RNA polymerase specialized sigma24 family protein
MVQWRAPARGPLDPAEQVALVARAKRETLLRLHRHRLRREDLEDCFSQATLELVAHAKVKGGFADLAHLTHVFEQRFLSRIRDRRRALAGRSPMQAALELALARGEDEREDFDVVDVRVGVEELVMLRMDLRRLPALARKLTPDQRLVLAAQISQMSRADFCRRYGWSREKYQKVAQRARARLRRLCDESQGVQPLAGPSEKQIGTHL